MKLREAPEWQVQEWLNVDRSMALADYRGRPIVALAFQMLCPGCVQHALPQLKRIRELFGESQLAVLGLHTVFEHHEAQGRPEVLKAFLHENRIRLPVAIDAPGEDGVPLTFRAYDMQGTPTVLLIDAEGQLRSQGFGHVDDLRLGAAIGSLLAGRAIDG
jgi:peroxiredoxin